MSVENNGPKVIVALDFDSGKKTLALTDQLDPSMCRLKIGKELFTRTGPKLVKHLVDGGFDIFLDLKFHDIPNTVAKACASAAELGVWMVNVHALGGPTMMAAARDALSKFDNRPILVAVTILTSMTEQDMGAVGLQGGAEENVLRLARLTEKTGLDGIVCSPWEVLSLRNEVNEKFKLVTPGIRPTGSSKDDQARVMTPKSALNAGSDYIVIGRPITQAKNPKAALQAICAEIK